MTTKTFPYELLRIRPLPEGPPGSTQCKRLQRGRWPSHVPLPCVGDRINETTLAGGYIVESRLFTKTKDRVLMVTLYIE
jgi:hypothetical protein